MPPTDWRRAGELSCSCADCKELSQFLGDPNESVQRFKVRKDRRQHLHRIIEGNRCDLTHVTTRTTTPQTLVCTKTKASYQLACKIYARDIENLKRLRAVVKKIESVVASSSSTTKPKAPRKAQSKRPSHCLLAMRGAFS
jgi:hypothetical protein